MNRDEMFVPITVLGDAEIASPIKLRGGAEEVDVMFVPASRRVRYQIEVDAADTADASRADADLLLFEQAGARRRIWFDPATTRAALVTCGGLCPGLNDVIRSAFLELHMNYGVQEVFGIRYGYAGLNPAVGLPPVRLTAEMVEDIHREGGTLLGSSRGPQEPAVVVDFLERQGIGVLLCIGGDGTLRGAHAIAEEALRRKANVAVVGVPKTIDNDIPYCHRSFGLATAVDIAHRVLDCAHVEAKGALNGIGLVKLMGRDAGFIAAAATLANQDVNFTLIPESPFKLHGPGGFLEVLHERICRRQHAVIVVAEGAGQDLFAGRPEERDASGNVRHHDIGLLLRDEILAYFAEHGPPVSIKYIDPSYIIRSVPANCDDSVICDQYARLAVHAAMAGKTDLMIGYFNDRFAHVPLAMATAGKRRVDVKGQLWASVLAATGQPVRFG